ncbi:vacuolar protein sorting-associated protein 72 homolog isoform X1 [Ornithorhynchus anatinus]|uniref:Vacuolar protein sorting-associated protein 72 homolog n=1 Tax=Ornithorhynchus anatinus TaxID=9258 RepID=A0A6I8ND93_ORNAN|nr:vacuolar protein sorting-associated protein 72 homolog isoform X1 [Ornithorhynchus anatinus]
MSLAGGRAPRKTAGNRLSGLLEAEEEDEFYQTTYGGFTEESGDDEYQGDQSDTEDEVDSDFDIDEGDEPASDGEVDEPKRKRRVVLKAYKEPLKSLRPRKASAPPGGSQKAREEKGRLPPKLLDDGSDGRKSMRQSTAEHTRQTFLRVQERQGQSRRRKGPHCERPLTQEELLREAKDTEELNLRSLETYERLEADKKKQVHKKRRCPGPVISFHSLTVPLLADPGAREENVDVEGLDPAPAPPATPALCSRTLVTFSDDETFGSWFPRGRPPRVPVREVCPVTHRPARYRDPVTDIPYATARAFKIIREAYKKYIAAHGLPPAASALGPAPPGPPEPPCPRGLRQKITLK